MPSLNWIGKEAVVNHDKEVPFKLLKKIKTASVNNGSQNLIIHGDNLEGLKALMPYYYGGIKCIYIDPPYNTGNESWVYNDKVNSPKIKQWLHKVVGSEGEDLTRHDKWLCMMYPRLKLLRDLLRDDGVIFISIDDNEHCHLKMIMDEIFGEENFVHTLKWKRKKQPSYLHGHVASIMEYVLIYAKNILDLEKLSLGTRENINTRVDNSSNAVSERLFKKGVRVKLDKKISCIKKGVYKNKTMQTEYLSDVRIKNNRTVNEVVVKTRFRNNQEQINEFIDSDVLFITKNYGLRRDLLSSDLEKRKAITDLLLDWGDNQDSDKELGLIFPEGKPFAYPKPSLLIKNLIASLQYEEDQDFIVLDSFAGSGTTGHAVLDLNKEDSGNRKFILIEIEDHVAKDITAERVKRVIKKSGYQDGFEYCELDKPLFNERGYIEITCNFNELATYIYFTETQKNIDIKNIDGNFIGEDTDTKYYLIYKELKKNDLNKGFIKKLRKTDGKKIVYADRCLLDNDQLLKYNVVFKQIPYEIDIY